jgi:dihydrodipicolinate synthase/N-acetylneuraminate lyase
MQEKAGPYPLFGIVTVLNTPFTEDDQVDLQALKKHVRYAIDAGVAGILVPAMAAEVYKLSVKERLAMVNAVLEEADGRVPVIAGAGESDLHKSKQLLRQYLDLGCVNTLFQIPYRDETQFKDHFLDLASLGPEMIMLQDWDASGYGLPESLICDLFEQVEAFRCLKVEVVPAGVKYSRILEMTGGRLHVSGGWAVSQMIEGLQRGVHAFMPTGMHRIYTAIYRLFRQGNQDQAEALFNRLLPVLSFSNQHLDISIHFFKRLLHRQGIYPTSRVRDPILAFDAIHRQRADHLIDQVLAMEAELEKDLIS